MKIKRREVCALLEGAVHWDAAIAIRLNVSMALIKRLHRLFSKADLTLNFAVSEVEDEIEEAIGKSASPEEGRVV